MSLQPATFAMGGGVDTSSAALATPPGALLYGENYEPTAEGYTRISGYERYDGRTAPSAASFYALDFDAGSTEIALGDTVTGGTSGATGYVVLDPYGVTGDWGAGTAAGTLVLAVVSGTFQDDEDLEVSASPCAVADGVASENDAPTDALFTTWKEAVMAYQRTLVAKPTGSGPCRGIAVHDGSVYAWRDNVGATAAGAFKATAAGWSALTATVQIPFTSGGTTEIAEGDTIVGATSTETADVLRVTVTSGTWAGGDAAGYIYVTNASGAFSGENLNIDGGASNVATTAGSSETSFAAGGRYRTISHNFYGASDLYRLYGASGVDNGFEMIDDELVKIHTGMTSDLPQRVFEIANHLGFTFAGGSVQFSGTGEPTIWSPILGAAEIGLGTDVTDVVQANETAVAIFGKQKVAILTGHDVDDFLLDTLTEEAGAEADTAQRIAKTVYLDLRGVRDLAATQAYGNFKTGALSQMFEKLIKDKRTAGITAIGSLVSRTKSQYRIFWSDGTGLTIYMGKKYPEAIPFNLGFVPTCFAQGELADGEALFVGHPDGWVIRLDSGNNYDGEQIEAVGLLSFNSIGSPRVEKRFHAVSFEMQGPPSAQIRVSATFNYGEDDQPSDDGRSFEVRGGGGYWNQELFDNFYWSDPIEGMADCEINGRGINVSVGFSTTAGLTEPPHTMQAHTIYWTPRRLRRRRR